MAELLRFSEIQAGDLARVGGKALSLGLMFQGGLNVPPGFVVTTEAYRRMAAVGLRADAHLVSQINAAYSELGSGAVAVRSSAWDEDSAESSFAGQQDTFLGVQGEAALLDAIGACWRSLQTERAKAYRQQRGLADDSLGLAVVVQQLVPAEVAGVLFTRDPHDLTGERICIEASWGLGESVVSGKVTPDRFLVNRTTGEILERQVGSKLRQRTVDGERPVPPEQSQQLCLSDWVVTQLAGLARTLEAFFQSPRDVEWALVGDTIFLLQARPITTSPAVPREKLRQAVISQVREWAEPSGTVWVRYNLSEILPEPTPMTWAIAQRLVAADGGLGAMNRDLGGSPDPSLGSLSAFDLIASRPMCNLSRLPRLQFAHPPIEYSFARMKSDPALALNPRPVLNPLRTGWLGLLRLPGMVWRLSQMHSITRRLVDRFPEAFSRETMPQFRLDCRRAWLEDWRLKSSDELLTLLRHWTDHTLITFAKESLKPTVLAELCWSTLREVLKPRLGEEAAEQAVGQLALGARPPELFDLNAALGQVQSGILSRVDFVKRFGHRGPKEMELSQPRWQEDPLALDALLQAADYATPPPMPPDPWAALVERYKLGPNTRAAGQRWAVQLRLYLGLREAAKHHLMMGYALIRRVLVELDQRFQLQGGLFFLTPDELPRLLAGESLQSLIRARQEQRRSELQLELPTVLFSDDLDAIGRPQPLPPGVVQWTGIALSAGVAQAPALVLHEPTQPIPSEPFILVCPSTDPAWVPYFSQAQGLVMELGGVLSHGAIVAREYGLPAVAGLPGLCQQLQTGQVLRVDGGAGTVTWIDRDKAINPEQNSTNGPG